MEKSKSSKPHVIELSADDSLLCSVFANDSKCMNQFLKYQFQHQPVVIRGDEERMSVIRDDFMHHLDLQSILENTSSDSIHVWLKSPMRDDNNSSLDSIMVENAASALKLHNAGHSLYCRASPYLEQAMVPKLLNELGMGIIGSGCDRFRRGEVETFISKRNHVTEWHTDFQENFTFQLSGRKKWYFKSSSAVAPLRGCTPHFGVKQDPPVVEMQVKALFLGNPHFQADEFLQTDAEPDDERESCVIINPGDFLYHPAGVWHRVECVDDSIAINVSLVGASYAEIASSALQQVLWQDKRWRGPVILRDEEDALRTAQILLEAAGAAIKSLSARDILPRPGFGGDGRTITHSTVGNDIAKNGDNSGEDEGGDEEDGEGSDSDNGAGSAHLIDVASFDIDDLPSQFLKSKKFRFNPIAVICSESDLHKAGWVRPKISVPSDSALFVVHCNFGNESLESVCRTVVCVPALELPIATKLAQWKRDSLSIFTLDELTAHWSPDDDSNGKKRKRTTKGAEKGTKGTEQCLRILYCFFQSGLLAAVGS